MLDEENKAKQAEKDLISKSPQEHFGSAVLHVLQQHKLVQKKGAEIHERLDETMPADDLPGQHVPEVELPEGVDSAAVERFINSSGKGIGGKKLPKNGQSPAAGSGFFRGKTATKKPNPKGRGKSAKSKPHDKGKSKPHDKGKGKGKYNGKPKYKSKPDSAGKNNAVGKFKPTGKGKPKPNATGKNNAIGKFKATGKGKGKGKQKP